MSSRHGRRLGAGLLWLCLLASTAHAQPDAAAPAAAHHEHLPGQIRHHHLSRLVERAASTPEALRQQCRFESDIATPPPAGLVALTFDDGPDPEHTEQILAVLERYKLPATFFFIGEKMQQHPELVRKVLDSGRHLVGSHSWSHPNFHELDAAQQTEEIDKGLAQMPAGQALRLFRYPYGNASCQGNEVVHARGYQIVGWHVDSCDWAFDRHGSLALHEAVACGVAPAYRADFVGHVAHALDERHGGILLMHEIHPHTLARLPELIEAIQRLGLGFTRADDPRLAGSLR